MKGKAIISIAMIVAVLASAGGAVSGEFFTADDCPDCPQATLPSPCGTFAGIRRSCSPFFDSEPSLKVLTCLYNYDCGKGHNPDSGMIKMGAYLSPDRGLDADKALSDFKLARKECLEYCESPGTEKLRDKNDGDDREFVYISKDDFSGGPCYRYEVRGYLLYRENYLIYVNANAEYKDQKERYCEPVGDSYVCKFVDPTDTTHLSDANDAIIRFNALAKCAKSVIDKKCGEGLSRVDVVQIPKHVVKDVEARFITYAYDSKGRIIPTTDLAYEWHIDSTTNPVATSSQILDYEFDTTGPHSVYCKVTYGDQEEGGNLEVDVEDFKIEFKSSPFSPMKGETADVEFKVNTPALVSFDRVIIPKKYYSTWFLNGEIDIDEEITVIEADQWYSVLVWDGRIENGRPAINGEYMVELEAKPLPWWFSEDKTCQVQVYDDPGKFVSIEREHIKKRPHPAHKSGEVKGYVKWLGGEEGVYVVKIGKIGASTLVAALTGGLSFLESCIVGTIAGQYLDWGDDLCVEYVALYEYKLEKVHWYPYVTDGGTKYGPIQNWIPILMREDVTITSQFSGTQVTKQEKREKVGVPLLMSGLHQYIDQNTIKKEEDPKYTYSIDKKGNVTRHRGTWHDISNANLYGKDTLQGKKYRERVLNTYKRRTQLPPVAQSTRQSEIVKAAGLCYGSESIYDFSPLSAPSESYASAQSQPSEFTDSFSDYETDADGDGLYDTLTYWPGWMLALLETTS